jgi:hypothetical protein
MPLGAFRLNGLGKFQVTAAAQVIRSKKGITAMGNAQVSTAQSRIGNSSYLGDGSGDYLILDPLISITHTGSWTIECWLRAPSTSISITAIANYLASGAFNGWGLRIGQTLGRIEFWDGVAWRNFNSAAAINTWYHVAIVSTAGSVKMYQDGVEQTTTFTLTTAFNNTTTRTFIGAITDGTFAWNGNLDEIRISNSARYSANFTPSTTPFTNDDNTVLLLHMSGTNGSTFFEDDNGVRLQQSIRAIGNAQISTAQSRFSGSSLLLDGNGDNLTIGSYDGFAFGTGNFTIEAWVYWTEAGNGDFDQIFNCQIDTSSNRYPALGITDGSKLYYSPNFGTIGIQDSTNFTKNSWVHVAVSRSSGSTRMFVNGTQVGSTYTDTNNFTLTGVPKIGSAPSGSFWIGYIDEVRVSNSARYTTNFTAPSAPFVNDANTVLLVHCDGTNASTVFRDDNGDSRTPFGFSALGNAQVDTAQSRFGNAAALFDGTGDYLLSTTGLSLGTGNFTIECWIRVASLQAAVIFDNRTSDQPGVFTIQANGTLLYFDPAVGGVSTSGTYTTNTWFHACFERSGNTFRMYINGTASYTNTNFTSNLGTNRQSIIGISYAITSGLNGWIDEFRISNTARYAGNFTAPTAPFQDDSNTLMLLHMDGTDGSTVFIDDNGKNLS